MNSNHDEAIPASVLQEIEGLFKQIMAKLEKYHTPLTADERKEMTTVGDKTIAFIEKGREYMDLYPNLVPQWLSKKEFSADFEDVHNLTPIRNLTDQIREAVYNIYYTAGDEAYQWMLNYYHSIKQAAANDVPNAKIVAAELGKRFHGRRRRRPDEGNSSQA